MNLYCNAQISREMKIEKDRQNAKNYIETLPSIKPEVEEMFFEALDETIDEENEMPFVSRVKLEKLYKTKRIANMKSGDDITLEIKALELLDEFDHLVCQQIATGLFEGADLKNEIFFVNESRYCRIKKSLLETDGAIYTMGQKK